MMDDDEKTQKGGNFGDHGNRCADTDELKPIVQPEQKQLGEIELVCPVSLHWYYVKEQHQLLFIQVAAVQSTVGPPGLKFPNESYAGSRGSQQFLFKLFTATSGSTPSPPDAGVI